MVTTEHEAERWALPNTGPRVTAGVTCPQRQPWLQRAVQRDAMSLGVSEAWTLGQEARPCLSGLPAPTPTPAPSHALENPVSRKERGGPVIGWSALPPLDSCSQTSTVFRGRGPVWFSLHVASCCVQTSSGQLSKPHAVVRKRFHFRSCCGLYDHAEKHISDCAITALTGENASFSTQK